jgi:hypothetical protein
LNDSAAGRIDEPPVGQTGLVARAIGSDNCVYVVGIFRREATGIRPCLSRSTGAAINKYRINSDIACVLKYDPVGRHSIDGGAVKGIFPRPINNAGRKRCVL